MDKFYEFCLDDYAAPSCTSGYKYYYGTKEHFQKLLNSFSKNSRKLKEEEVFKQFCDGKTRVTNIVGFAKRQFAKKVKVLAEKEIDTNNQETYRYKNPYGFYYDLRMEYVENHVLLLKSGKRYVIAYYSFMKNPQYENELAKNGWTNIDMLMGFPAMIRIRQKLGNYYCSNRLYVVERVFDKKAEAQEYFNSMQKVDYKSFFEDVFGDG